MSIPKVCLRCGSTQGLESIKVGDDCELMFCRDCLDKGEEADNEFGEWQAGA